MANDLRINGKIVLTCATTAIAACLLPKGRTVHYKLKVPLSLHPNLLLGFSKESPTSDVLNQAQLLVIDEVTMADRWMLEAIDRTLRDVRDQKDTLFGGLPVLLSGDWRQCLPVVTKGSRADIVYKTVKASSTIWQNPNIYHLTENMRVKNAGEDEVENSESGEIGFDGSFRSDKSLKSFSPDNLLLVIFSKSLKLCILMLL